MTTSTTATSQPLDNNMTGDLPILVSEMTSFRHLYLCGNYLSGSIPYLAVSGNELTRAIPPELRNLSTLQQLSIGYYNTFSGNIPLKIRNLSELVQFEGASCGLSGAIPTEINKLQNLDTLFLQVNAFAGALTTELGYLKSLKSIDLSNNMFSSEILASFAQLKNLTLLNPFQNKLHGLILEFTGNL
ncbi:hypothetical protein ACSBR2_040260 [Camellia fascicularis]